MIDSENSNVVFEEINKRLEYIKQLSSDEEKIKVIKDYSKTLDEYREAKIYFLRQALYDVDNLYIKEYGELVSSLSLEDLLLLCQREHGITVYDLKRMSLISLLTNINYMYEDMLRAKDGPQKYRIFDYCLLRIIDSTADRFENERKLGFVGGVASKINNYNFELLDKIFEKYITIFSGSQRIEFIREVLLESVNDSYKKTILNRYVNDFEGEDRAKFIVEISKLLYDDEYKEKIIEEYVDDFEDETKIWFITNMIGAIKSIMNTSNIFETYKNDFEGKQQARYILEFIKNVGNIYIKKKLIKKNIHYFNGEEKKNFLIEISRSKITLTGFVSYGDFITSLLEDYADEFEDEMKSSFVSSMLLQLNEYNVKEVIDKYISEFDGDIKYKFIMELLDKLAYEDIKLDILDEFLVGLDYEEKKRIIYKCNLSQQNTLNLLDTYNIEYTLQDIFRIYHKDDIQISPEEFLGKDSKSQQDLLNGVYAAGRIRILRLCFKEATDEEKSQLLEIVLTDDDKSTMINRYFTSLEFEEINKILEKSKQVLSQEELEKYNILFKIRELLLLEEKEEIISNFLDVDAALQKVGEKVDNLINELNTEIKVKCTLDVCDKLLKKEELEKAPKRIIKVKQNINGQDVEKEIPIYDITDMKYLMLVHKINAYSTILNMAENIAEEWNQTARQERKSTISVCPITEVFSGHVEGSPTICFFDNVSPERIFDMGDRDIVITHEYDSEVPQSMHGENYFLMDDLMENIFYGYAEIGLFRDAQTLDDIHSVGEQTKLQPSAVMCYTDEPDEMTIKCALDFNIPIIYINTIEQAKKRREELDKKIRAPETYEDINKANKVLNAVISHACGLQYLNVDDRIKLTNENALLEMMEALKNIVLQEIDRAQDVKVVEVVEPQEKIILLKKLRQSIKEREKETIFHTGYRMVGDNGDKIIQEVTEKYEEAKERIDVLNTIRDSIKREKSAKKTLLRKTRRKKDREKNQSNIDI